MTRPTRLALAVALSAAVQISSAVLPAEPAAAGSTRRAPLRAEGDPISGGLSLADAQVEDDLAQGVAPAPPVRRISAFLFRVSRSSSRTAGFEVQVTMPDGAARSVTFAGVEVRSGAEVRLPVDVRLPAAAEGRLEVAVAARNPGGKDLFSARYSLGFPRYGTTAALRRLQTGALVKDAFDSERIDESRWRASLATPGSATIRQAGGRLEIHVDGAAGYNGLAGVAVVPARDVVLVARMGIDSGPESFHRGLLHLCGSGGLSPDNWIEIALGPAPGGGTASLNLSSPMEEKRAGIAPVALPGSAAEGHLFQLLCDPSSHACRGYVRAGESWSPIGSGYDIPARTSHVELKAEAWNGTGQSSTVWFDDCRMYPTPETHYVSVRLSRRGGEAAGLGAGNRWPPVAFGPRNAEIADGDVTVRLYARDGATLVDEAAVTLTDGYAMLRLDASPWDVYPVAAILRVFIQGEQAGPDHVIESAGVEGLYPDDVYEIEID